MDRKEIRLTNVRALIQKSGGLAKFARYMEMSSSQVSQFGGANPTRTIGDTIAERIERAFSKPLGWLDQMHAAHATAENGLPIRPLTQQAQTLLTLFDSLPERDKTELIDSLRKKKEYYDQLWKELAAAKQKQT